MKKLISLVSKLLINTIIFFVVFLLCFLGFILFISKINNIPLEDSVAHIKTVISNDIPTSSTNINYTNDISTITTTNNNFYYKQLDNNEKILYDAFENNINNLKKENYVMDFYTNFNTLLNKPDGKYQLNRSFQTAIDAFFYDHPELFYIDLTKFSLNIHSISIGSKTTYTVKIAPKDGTNYLDDNFSSEVAVNKAILKVENIRENILNNISKKDNYTKVLNIHDILIDMLKYNINYEKNNRHNIYGALIENEVVCEGYAKAFKYILDSTNIECILVSGSATNSSGETESHMWNYIKLDNNWYGVDLTWDDPIILGNTNKNVIRHSYFCKGYNTFDKSHFANNKISDNGNFFTLPKLSSKNYK